MCLEGNCVLLSNFNEELLVKEEGGVKSFKPPTRTYSENPDPENTINTKITAMSKKGLKGSSDLTKILGSFLEKEDYWESLSSESKSVEIENLFSGLECSRTVLSLSFSSYKVLSYDSRSELVFQRSIFSSSKSERIIFCLNLLL